MKVYLKTLDIVYKFLMYTVAIALTVMICVSFTEVIRRYIFSKSYPWADDLIRYMIIYVGFAGGAAAFRNKALVGLDLFTGFLSKKVQVIVELICNTIILFFLIFLLKYSIDSVQSPSIQLQKGIGLKISMAIPFMALPIGFACMIVFCIDNYRLLYRRLKGETEQ